jgi:hypothetical protein
MQFVERIERGFKFRGYWITNQGVTGDRASEVGIFYRDLQMGQTSTLPKSDSMGRVRLRCAETLERRT